MSYVNLWERDNFQEQREKEDVKKSYLLGSQASDS